MSAGDIIDRAVRLYRKHFLVLLRIVLGPSLVAYAGAIMFSIGYRNFSTMRGDTRVAATTALMLAGAACWIAGKLIFYAVLGGSSRSLVAHFFNGREILARDVYRAVRERIWGLLGSMVVIVMMFGMVAMMLMFVEGILFMIIGAIGVYVFPLVPEWMQIVLSILTGLTTVGVALFSFLLVYSRLVYVPQILMVENKPVSSSISRSFSLAAGEMRRIGAVILFWIYVAWSLWVLLTAPVGIYADSIGVDISPFNQAAPLWYGIANQTIAQVSEILIAPIAMLGFTLLYLNSRVRKEGYDVELLANRVLAPPPRIEMPVVTTGYPTAPAFPSILGLNDYAPADVAQAVPESVRESVAPEQFAEAAAPLGAEAADVAVVGEAIPVTVAVVAPEEASVVNKTCHWCGSNGSVEDRFCRVCGSVY
ncbi:MAG: hypothetical protein SF339_25505 [Blastocatellia bacterium]|nr:hypothetical protein [Blastocatellia bacterium]